MSTDALFQPIKVGALELPNRIVMAPLTRQRAGSGNIPHHLNATYYEQRASAGLIISEATQVAPEGLGYPHTPGIHSTEQVAGWRLVTDAVHEKGGRIFLQLWHVGRISHPDLQPNSQLPMAPSAIAPQGESQTYEGMKPYVTPRALETEEIPHIVEQYRQGAKNALEAGFDGVEIHGANGYLIDQFLRDGTNHRSDRYGGSIENRARFLMEIIEAILSVWESGRVGLRLSPSGVFNSMHDSNPQALFDYVVTQLNQFNLAYLHLIEPRQDDQIDANAEHLGAKHFRPLFNNPIITASGYDYESGNAVIEAGDADLVAYGRLYIANPDLPERFAQKAALNKPDRSTFYGGGEHGYVDYPSLEKQPA